MDLLHALEQESRNHDYLARRYTDESFREVAALMNFRHNTVLRWVKSGKMPCTRFGLNTSQLTFDQVVSFIEKLETANNVIWKSPAIPIVVAGQPNTKRKTKYAIAKSYR